MKAKTTQDEFSVDVQYDSTSIYIQNDCSQISIESEDNGNTYIDCDKQFLIELRNAIDLAISYKQ